MATTHLYAVGRPSGGTVDIALAPRRQQPVCSDSHGCRCYAYSHGYDDAKAGYLPEPLHHVSALCCIARYMAGHRDAGMVTLVTPVPAMGAGTGGEDAAQMPLVDGELQRLIDEGEATADYEDYLADVTWMRSGC